jgi:hypothetical protein
MPSPLAYTVPCFLREERAPWLEEVGEKRQPQPQWLQELWQEHWLVKKPRLCKVDEQRQTRHQLHEVCSDLLHAYSTALLHDTVLGEDLLFGEEWPLPKRRRRFFPAGEDVVEKCDSRRTQQVDSEAAPCKRSTFRWGDISSLPVSMEDDFAGNNHSGDRFSISMSPSLVPRSDCTAIVPYRVAEYILPCRYFGCRVSLDRTMPTPLRVAKIATDRNSCNALRDVITAISEHADWKAQERVLRWSDRLTIEFYNCDGEAEASTTNEAEDEGTGMLLG